MQDGVGGGVRGLGWMEDTVMGSFASLFSGAGLADEGARLAGLTSIWGVEVAEVPHRCALENHHPVLRADVRAVDFLSLIHI